MMQVYIWAGVGIELSVPQQESMQSVKRHTPMLLAAWTVHLCCEQACKFQERYWAVVHFAVRQFVSF